MSESQIHSFGEVTAELIKSSKQLVQSEIALVRAEMKESISNAGRHTIQVGVYGALLTMSVLPFIAFLIIGLGGLLGGMYWLSSLIISLVFGFIGGIMAFRAYNKIKEDFTLPYTRSSIQHSAEVVAGRNYEAQHQEGGAQVLSIQERNERKVS